MDFLKFEKDELLKKLVKKIPENAEITSEILKELGNSTTKIKLDKDIKNSYYVYLKDTIYLADNERNNTGVSRVCLIAHECKHSVQSKLLQKLNFIFSNIEIILFLVTFILLIFFDNLPLTIIYTTFALISLIPRIILEIDAVLSSTKIAKKYLESKLEEKEAEMIHMQYVKSTKSLLPFFIISLSIWKIIRIALVFIMYFI